MGRVKERATTRYAYKIYFVNKVNAITNKLDFVPCSLYFVAEPLHFWPGNRVGTEAGTVGKSLKCASGATSSGVVSALCAASDDSRRGGGCPSMCVCEPVCCLTFETSMSDR